MIGASWMLWFGVWDAELAEWLAPWLGSKKDEK